MISHDSGSDALTLSMKVNLCWLINDIKLIAKLNEPVGGQNEMLKGHKKHTHTHTHTHTHADVPPKRRRESHSRVKAIIYTLI